MVSKGHKITNVPLFKKIWDIIDFLWENHFMIHFSGHFKGASKWLISNCPPKNQLFPAFS